MRKLLAVLVVLLVGTLWFASPALADGTNLIVNGGFETGDFTGWTLSGNTAGAGIFYFVDSTDAFSGNFGAALGAEGSPLDLSQTLATTNAGETYTISFELAENLTGNPTSGSNNTFVASFGGVTGVSLINPTTNVGSYEFYSFVVDGTGAPTTLSLLSENDSDFWSLDNVSVSAPEPASMLLLGTGLAGLAGAFRRRNRKLSSV